MFHFPPHDHIPIIGSEKIDLITSDIKNAYGHVFLGVYEN